ncbi:MAG: NfeD family protein [Verrucomicrobiae bacterium]|nr:NfeD family protein [Verrucomicrobiae bacterium]
MKWPLVALLACFGFSALSSTPPASREKPSPDPKRPVYVIPIRDDIEPSIVFVIRRGIKEANDNNAQAIIIDMSTNGGRVDCMEEIVTLIESFKGETITYVNKKAYSAGAFIAVATKHIHMAPSSVIGAAAPIMLNPSSGEPQALPNTIQKKISSGIAARMRAAAQRNGHNPELVDAMVRETEGLKIDGKEIVKKGDILTLTDTEATARYGAPPKPLLAQGIANSFKELCDQYGYKEDQIRQIQSTGAEKAARWITLAAPVLLLIGMAGIYLEFKTPGVSLPGIIGVCALALFFFGHYIAGLSGFEEILLFAIGLILIGVEVFVLPGHVLPGFLGIVAILVAILWAMVDKVPAAPGISGVSLPLFLPKIQVPLLKLASSIIGAGIVIAILARYLPQGKGPAGKLMLHASLDKKDGYATAETHLELVGQKGVTLSMLRPSGTARVGNQVLDVITAGDFVGPNQPVIIREVRGAQIIVEKTSE